VRYRSVGRLNLHRSCLHTAQSIEVELVVPGRDLAFTESTRLKRCLRSLQLKAFVRRLLDRPTTPLRPPPKTAKSSVTGATSSPPSTVTVETRSERSELDPMNAVGRGSETRAPSDPAPYRLAVPPEDASRVSGKKDHYVTRYIACIARGRPV
jgi:hypothetical protein